MGSFRRFICCRLFLKWRNISIFQIISARSASFELYIQPKLSQGLQIIDDEQGVTLVSASTMDKDFNGNGGNVEAAAEIGKKVAAKALEKGITEVVFDRGGYVYHGRVKALADGAREGGLKL